MTSQSTVIRVEDMKADLEPILLPHVTPPWGLDQPVTAWLTAFVSATRAVEDNDSLSIFNQ